MPQVTAPSIRFAAYLLLASFAIPLIGAVALALTGRLTGAYSQPGDPTVDFAANRWVMRMAIVSMILAVLGLALLSARLWSETATSWAFVGLACAVLAGIGWIVEVTLTFGIAETAAAEAAETGAIPDYAQALKIWGNQALQPAYVLAGMIGIVAYGLGLLDGGLAPAAIGWTMVGWGGFWALLAVAGTLTIPAVFLAGAALAGVGLLL